MKIRNILILIELFAVIVSAQTGSINNTLGTGGSFIVKDATDNFLRVDQLTGNTIFLRNLELGNQDNSTQSIGLITKNGVRYIHNYSSPGTDGYNTFIGLYAGNFPNVSGFNYYASYNTAVGFGSIAALTSGFSNSALEWGSLTSNTIGFRNSAFGDASLYSNTTGDGNAAFGYHSLFSNQDGYSNSAFGQEALYSNDGLWNSAFGFQSLYSNTAHNNSAFGHRSLYSNITNNNSAFGFKVLYSNTFGDENSAFGNQSLESNTTGGGNTAIGYRSLQNNTEGYWNMAIGKFSGSFNTTGTNNITIGYNAQVPNNAGNHQVRIGNASISYAGIQVAWSITSDKRWKENINPSDLGLEFISKLNPVLYTRINDVNQKIEYGLIAQELEQVLKEEGVVNSAMLTIDGDGRYELRYNDLLAPMIKAIQELKNRNDQLRSEVESLNSVKQQLADIESLKEELAEQIKMLKENNESMNIKFSSIDN